MGDSPSSQAYAAKAEVLPQLPSAPTIFNVPTITDNTRIGLKWEAPDFDGHTPLISYRLQAALSN